MSETQKEFEKQSPDKDKTHYRKAFNSPYLSSADVVDPVMLTVSKVTLEPDKTHKTKDNFNTAYFAEKQIRPGETLKPMILNATNSRTMRDLTGSPYIDDWQNISVTVYVDPNVRFGNKTLEGLRISTEAIKKLSSDQINKITDRLKTIYGDDPSMFFDWIGVQTVDAITDYAKAKKGLDGAEKAKAAKDAADKDESRLGE